MVWVYGCGGGMVVAFKVEVHVDNEVEKRGKKEKNLWSASISAARKEDDLGE